MSVLAGPAGRVLQVSVGRGGVPKLAVERAWVGRYGLEGDRVRERTMHGGPFRAVCLFGIEVIQRLEAEGHPVGPGSVGENLTTEGVEWSVQPPGTRIAVGDTVLLELTTPTNPCSTQKPNFREGRFGRISILTHPSDSRMYAMVLREGEVRPGDPITLLPAVPDSEGQRAGLFARLDSAVQEGDLRLWNAAIAAGQDVRVLHDGQLSAAAAPHQPGWPFNHAAGLRGLPNLLPRVLDFYRSNGVPGWLPMLEEPWPGALIDHRLSVLAATPRAIAEVEPVDGIGVRELSVGQSAVWAEVMEEVGTALGPGVAAAIAPHLVATRGVHILVAEHSGVPVGVSSLHVHRRVGLLRSGVVVPAARGRGIQRLLIAARAALAAELGCDLVTSQAGPDSTSERNLIALGMDRLAIRDVYRFDPAESADPTAGVA